MPDPSTADRVVHALEVAARVEPGIHDRVILPHHFVTGLATEHAESFVAIGDLSSSYFEGSHCRLAKLAYNRDGKRGTLQVNCGLLTDDRGGPVAFSVHEGNTSDNR